MRGAPQRWEKGVIPVHVHEGSTAEVTLLGANPEGGLRFEVKNKNMVTREYDT